MKQNRGEFRKSDAQNNHLLGDGQFALGIISGLLIAIIIYLLLDFSEQWPSRTELIDIIPTLSILLVAFVSLLLSFRALIEQKKMRQAGTDPVLIAHLAQLPDEPMIIMFKVSNVGSGAALNVKMGIISPDSDHNSERMITNLLKITNKEMKVILQNTSVEYDFGVGHELFPDTPIPPFEVDISYQDIDGSLYSSRHKLDVAELLGRPANSPARTKIWRELEKIRKEIAKKK